ncbi:MAG: c-type cytochrome, partial [Gemmataceae bacterium]
KQFELFSEGGGNTYGLDFDRHGNAISGTNWGGFAMLHQMQGADDVKGFSKHGPLHNPHAYGYFDHVPYKNFKGGHVTCGGILYDADVYPKYYHHQCIAGNLMSNAVYWHKLTPKGASFTAEHGGELLEANDTWFRPVDLQLGPDGCVYVADWYDKRAAHLDPIDNWDKTNGRVYKIEYTKPGEPRGVSPRVAAFDLRKKSNDELLDLLKHPNMWWRREARRLLAERPADKETLAALVKMIQERQDFAALEALWVAASLKPNWETYEPGLVNPDENVRAWAIRLGIAGDVYAASGTINWEDFIRKETSPRVLAQCAISVAGTTWGGSRNGMFDGLFQNPVVKSDPLFKDLIWWSMERLVSREDRPGFAGLLNSYDPKPVELRVSLIRKLACRVCFTPWADRYLMRQMLDQDAMYDGVILLGVLDALRRIEPVRLQDATIERLKTGKSSGVRLGEPIKVGHWDRLELHARLKQKAAVEELGRVLNDVQAPEPDRVKALGILRGLPGSVDQAALLSLLRGAKADGLRRELLVSLAEGEGPDAPAEILSHYSSWSAAVKAQAVRTLLARPRWALAVFQAHADGKFPKADLSVDHARAAVALNDPELTKLVEKQFGKLASTAGEKRARIDALNAMFGREKPGDPAKGKVVFEKSCAACHQLFGEGGKVGPDLSSADRKNRYALLTNIVDPSGSIRPEFVTHVVNTLDGRTYSGVVTEQSAEKITIASYVNNKVETTAVARKDIDKLDASAVSLMPEKLLDAMSEAEIRDLMAYVMSEPKNPTPQPPPRNGEGEKKVNPDRKGG